jgi:hypothetical protein
MITAPLMTHRRIPSSDDAYWWLVEYEGAAPVLVELPGIERRGLILTDRDLHDLVPTALRRHAAAHGGTHIGSDSPVRLYADHFRG